MAADDAPPDEETISVGEKMRSAIRNFWDLPAIESVRGWRNSAVGFSDTAGERVHRAATGPVTGMYRALHQSPGAVIIILLLVSVFFGQYAVDFQHQINGDVEIYLPDGADSKELLLEVREGWSTDIVMLYIHTDNAIADETERGKCPEVDDCIYNVTSVHVLNQISYLEGEETSAQGNYDRGLDWDKADRGLNDGIVWILSAAQIVKEANSSRTRFACALEMHGIEQLQADDCTIANTNSQFFNDGYSIPNDQDTVNNLVENAGALMDSFVRDTNGDGIWDTAVVVIGIRFEMAGTQIDPRPDPKGEEGATIADHKAFIEYAHRLIYEKSDSMKCELCRQTYDEPLSSMWYEDESEWRLPDSGERRAITVTGLTPVLHDVSNAVYEQLVFMLPWSLGFVAITMIALHRNPKVLLICGLPIVMSLAVTFGFTVVADIMLTPMIIAAGPILIGLGVDYSLHLINRIEEGRNSRLEEAAEKAWKAERSGESAVEVDPWDPEIYLGATVDAVMTTGNAIFLSAITTIVGFSVLAWPELVPIQPMRTVGLTLVLGITCTFFFSMIMVPALGWVLRYRKRGTEQTQRFWNKVGVVPVRAWWAILLIAFFVSAAGVTIINAEMGKDITGSRDEVPPGLESYETLAEYSRVFEGGQTNMFIVDAGNHTPINGTAPIRDLAVLDEIEEMQDRIDTVPETTTISLVTILKAVHVEVEVGGFQVYDNSLWGLLHSPCWDDPVQPDRPLECLMTTVTTREAMVNVAFDTLSVEVRSMLMNEPDEGMGGETRTLVYVNQPYINLRDAGALREEIDSILTNGFANIDDVTVTKLTGGLPLSLDINKGIHDAQLDATLMTMLVLTIVMTVLFRSPRLALFTMTAVGVVVLWQPLLMRSGDVNVNVFTAMVSTIVFGIGVDDSIHIIDRIREEKETPGGIVKTVSRTGQTIFETTATTCAGLAAGLLVDIPALRNFFALMMILITLALLTSALLLPSLIVGWHTMVHAITGKRAYQDFDTDVTVDDETAIDAVLSVEGG